MANIGNYDGTKLMGCPIVYPVTAGTYDNAVFQRLRVIANITEGDVTKSFEFSTPVSGGETVNFDISSALRAVAEQHTYKPETLSYPSYGHSIDAYDDYLIDGEEYHSGKSTSSGGEAYVGTLTDRERMLYGTDAQELPSVWSRKPTTSPEICFVGNPHIAPGSFSNSPSVSLTPLDAESKPRVAPGMQTIDGYQIYGITQPADGFELRFINSLGVHENVFITCLRQTEVNIKNDFHVIARQETVTNFSRGVNVKRNDYEVWRMSSGPLDQAWQQYYLHEVLMAKCAWLNVDDQWLPVHIIPEETVTGIDRASGKLLDVQFSLRFDINGSPFK